MSRSITLCSITFYPVAVLLSLTLAM